MTLRRALVGGLLCIVAACSGGSSERTFVSVGTAPPGGAFFVVGSALAEVLAGATTDRGWQVTAEATSGSQENIRRLAQGELDFALSNAAITYFAVRGAEGWDREYPIRSVMTLAPNVALFIAPSGGAVRTIADLRGKRVVIGPAGAGFEYFVRPILAAHGVSYDDFTPLNATQQASVDMLADGSAAAVFLGGAVPTASITQAASSQSVHFVPYDPAVMAKLSADFLFFSPATIPAGTYRGQDTPFNGLDVGSMHLVTAADQDESLVYDVTKLLWELREQVVEKHPAGRAINPRNAVRDTGTAFHPGAIRFYREIGIWPN
jgi:TRAP transporter TAXI family solute receptor